MRNAHGAEATSNRNGPIAGFWRRPSGAGLPDWRPVPHWARGHGPARAVGLTQRLGVCSQLNVPLNINGARRGVLAAPSRHIDFFTDVDQSFLAAVSEWISEVMDRAELTRELLMQAEERGRRGRRAGRRGLSNQQIAQEPCANLLAQRRRACWPSRSASDWLWWTNCLKPKS